jgi:hypothetical protein
MGESADQRALPDAGPESHGKDLFSLLEQRVEALVDRHREALSRIQDLREELAGRDAQVAHLRSRVAALQELRAEVLRHLESLIARVDDLQRGAAARPPQQPEESALELPREATA